MKKLLGILLLAAGTFALAAKGFDYTKERHDAKLGPLEFSIKEKQRVEVPTWAGIGLVAAGGLLLALPRKKG